MALAFNGAGLYNLSKRTMNRCSSTEGIHIWWCPLVKLATTQNFCDGSMLIITSDGVGNVDVSTSTDSFSCHRSVTNLNNVSASFLGTQCPGLMSVNFALGGAFFNTPSLTNF